MRLGGYIICVVEPEIQNPVIFFQGLGCGLGFRFKVQPYTDLAGVDHYKSGLKDIADNAKRLGKWKLSQGRWGKYRAVFRLVAWSSNT